LPPEDELPEFPEVPDPDLEDELLLLETEPDFTEDEELPDGVATVLPDPELLPGETLVLLWGTDVDSGLITVLLELVLTFWLLSDCTGRVVTLP
jgi:hypothetical protein